LGLLGAILELPGIRERASRATGVPSDSNFIGVGIMRNFNVHPLLFQVVEDVWGPLGVAKEPVGKVPNTGEGIFNLAGCKASAVARGRSRVTHFDGTKVALWGDIEETVVWQLDCEVSAHSSVSLNVSQSVDATAIPDVVVHEREVSRVGNNSLGRGNDTGKGLDFQQTGRRTKRKRALLVLASPAWLAGTRVS